MHTRLGMLPTVIIMTILDEECVVGIISFSVGNWQYTDDVYNLQNAILFWVSYQLPEVWPKKANFYQHVIRVASPQ